MTEYKESARRFLASPSFRPFSKGAFAELFLRMIQEDTSPALDGTATGGA